MEVFARGIDTIRVFGAVSKAPEITNVVDGLLRGLWQRRCIGLQEQDSASEALQLEDRLKVYKGFALGELVQIGDSFSSPMLRFEQALDVMEAKRPF